MKEQPSNPCEKVSFILTYDQLEAAYNIYREQFISCDFITQRFIWKVAESDSFLQTFHGAADEVAGNKLFPVDVISSFKLVIGQNK